MASYGRCPVCHTHIFFKGLRKYQRDAQDYPSQQVKPSQLKTGYCPECSALLKIPTLTVWVGSSCLLIWILFLVMPAWQIEKNESMIELMVFVTLCIFWLGVKWYAGYKPAHH